MDEEMQILENDNVVFILHEISDKLSSILDSIQVSETVLETSAELETELQSETEMQIPAYKEDLSKLQVSLSNIDKTLLEIESETDYNYHPDLETLQSSVSDLNIASKQSNSLTMIAVFCLFFLAGLIFARIVWSHMS